MDEISDEEEAEQLVNEAFGKNQNVIPDFSYNKPLVSYSYLSLYFSGFVDEFQKLTGFFSRL